MKIKVGHAGTLDPLATGLMIICTGKKTKEIGTYQSADKEYIARIRLGSTTPSFDLETDIDRYYPVDHIDLRAIENTLQDLTGNQLQYPPVYSAKSVNGIRAYKQARHGSKIELNANHIVIYLLQLLSTDLPTIEILVSCSKGTYIRSLAHDIGVSLKSGAHLTALVRTKIGDFDLKDAIEIEEFERNLVFL